MGSTGTVYSILVSDAEVLIYSTEASQSIIIDRMVLAEGDLEYALRMVDAQATRLEEELDALNSDLEPLTSFVLPGGSPPAAYLHQARTVSRRAERICVGFAKTDAVNPHALTYLNRCLLYTSPSPRD